MNEIVLGDHLQKTEKEYKNLRKHDIFKGFMIYLLKRTR